jgi:Flp pilus assembly protein TadG
MINLKKITCRRGALPLRGEEGSSLVETALTFPVLILMLLGAVQLGEVAFAAIETANAARAGAQYAGMNGGGYNDGAGITAAAQADARDTTSLTATPSTSCACSDGLGTCTATGASGGSPGVYACSSGKPIIKVSVATTATYSALIKIPGMGSTYTLHGWAQQQVLK